MMFSIQWKQIVHQLSCCREGVSSGLATVIIANISIKQVCLYVKIQDRENSRKIF